MAFDLFSMPQGPAVPIELFGSAASQGTNVGKAVPTALSAGIQGAQAGIKTGQEIIENYQQAEIRQHQIDQFPVEDQIRASQLKSEQLALEVRELETEATLANRENILESKRLKAENDLAKERQIRDDYSTFNNIKDSLSSPNLDQRRSILTNPSFSDYMSRNPEQAESIIGNLYSRKDINEAEATRAYSQVDFYKAQQLEISRQNANKKINDTLSKDLDNAIEKLSDPTVKYTLQGLDSKQIINDVKVYPKGVKQYDDKTKVIIPGSTDNVPSGESNAYQVFVNNKLQPQELTKEQAGIITNVQDTYTRALTGQSATQQFLQRQGTPAPAQQAAAPDEAPAQPQTFDDLVKQSEAAGVPKEKATEILSEARESGKESNFVQQIFQKILPTSLQSNPIINSTVSSIYEDARTKNARAVIESSSVNLTNGTLQALNAGTSTDKDAIRTWAKANGVPLSYSGLKNYYNDRIASTLKQAYESAYSLGIAEQSGKTEQEVAGQALKEQKEQALVGKSPEEALKLGQDVEVVKQKSENLKKNVSLTNQLVGDLGARVDQVTSFYNVTPRTKDRMSASVRNVSFNPLLSDQPAHVKAIAAWENNGRNVGVSSTGVTGPMQVTQAAATDVSNQAKLDRPLNIKDPEQNVLAGQMYLDSLINMFNGIKPLAYAAYNAGPAAVKYAQKLAGGSDDWREVKKFMPEALQRYSRAYPQGVLEKLNEVYNYPEHVSILEEIFA